MERHAHSIKGNDELIWRIHWILQSVPWNQQQVVLALNNIGQINSVDPPVMHTDALQQNTHGAPQSCWALVVRSAR